MTIPSITLPWPPRELHPNARAHWAKKARHTKECRERAGWESKAAKVSVATEGQIGVCMVFCPPDKRNRDMDGCLSNCKAYLDGLADGLGVNDSRFKLSLEWGPVVAGGQVRIFVGGAA